LALLGTLEPPPYRRLSFAGLGDIFHLPSTEWAAWAFSTTYIPEQSSKNRIFLLSAISHNQ
jgi:hypothetical protein